MKKKFIYIIIFHWCFFFVSVWITRTHTVNEISLHPKSLWTGPNQIIMESNLNNIGLFCTFCSLIHANESTTRFFLVGTSNFKRNLAGAYFQTDFDLFFNIPLPRFMCLKCFLVKVLHVCTNKLIPKRLEHWFCPKILVKSQASGAYSAGAY